MSADTLTVEASAPAESVLVLMRDADLDFVPVVDGDRLVGVVTAADLLPAAPGELAARDLMTADVVTAPPWMRLPDAARLMLERSVRRIPVIEHDRLLGVLTKVDLLRAVTATGAPHDQVHRLPGAPRTVGEIAVTDVPTVTPAAPLTEVLDAVAATAGGYAVVVDGAGVVRGIVDEGEVLRRIEHATGGRGLGRVVHRLAQRRDEAGEIAAITAADVMGPPAPVPPDLPIDEAAARMVEARLLTVVDGVGRLIGVVDRWEALRSVLPAPAG